MISGIPYTFHQKESKKWSKAITGLEPKYDISDEIILFPNPAMQNSEISLNIKKGSLEVYGINGKLCVSKEINTHTIALTDLSLKKGIYFLRITAPDKAITQKMIMMKKKLRTRFKPHFTGLHKLLALSKL